MRRVSLIAAAYVFVAAVTASAHISTAAMTPPRARADDARDVDACAVPCCDPLPPMLAPYAP